MGQGGKLPCHRLGPNGIGDAEDVDGEALATIILNPKSLNPVAFGSILSLTSMLLIAAAGQTLVIISDGIDMSVGATMSMTALITVAVMQGKDSIGLMFAAMAACLVVGAVIGLCNGIGAVRAGLPPMVVTLYISNIVTRLQYVFTGGTPEYTSVPDWFRKLITTRLFGFFPTIVFFAVAFLVVVFFLLSRTRYGQQLTLTGNNNRAAFLTGIKTTKVKMLNYTIAGMLGGLAGFLIYNFHPAKVFMGDTGSLFLGGAVCGLAFALDVPLVLIPVGIIYIAETLSDIIQVGYFKLTHGKRIFRMAPLHHHLELGGWSEVRIVLTFTAITVAFCLLAFAGVMYRYGV